MEDKEKFNYIKEKSKLKDKVVGEVREALYEDVEQRKEIQLLKF